MTPGEPLAGAEVVVAGAGIAGSVLAYELARRGVDTLLLERGERGPAGASTVPAALINPHRGRSARATEADLEGARAFWGLTRDLAGEVGDHGAHPSGVLRLADNARQARVWQRLATRMVPGDSPEWLEPREVPDGYHAPFGGLLVRSGGWLESGRLLAALVEGASAHGARVAWGAELEGVTSMDAGNPARPRLAASVRRRGAATGAEAVPLECPALVVATGAEEPARLRLPGLQLVWGEARTFALDVELPYPLAGSAVAAFPAGRAVVSGGHRPVGGVTGGRPTAAGAHGPAADLRRALEWQVPAAAGAAELARWEGVRARRPSGEPVARRLCPGVYLLGAFGGRGFLRAASVASRLAEGLAAELGT